MIKRYVDYFAKKETISDEIKYYDQINKDFSEENNKKQNKYLGNNDFYNYSCLFDPNDKKNNENLNIYSNIELGLNENQISSDFEDFDLHFQENLETQNIQLNNKTAQNYFYPAMQIKKRNKKMDFKSNIQFNNLEHIIGKLKKNLGRKIVILMNFLAGKFKYAIKFYKDNNFKILEEDIRFELFKAILKKNANFLQYSLKDKIKKILEEKHKL